MKVLGRGENWIEVRFRSGMHWVLALLLIVPGLMAVSAAAPMILFRGPDAPMSVTAAAMGVVAIVAGGAVLRRSPMTVFRLLRGHRATIDTGWLLPLRRRSLGWDEIRSVELLRDRDSEGGAVFKPSLVLRTGERIPLASYWSHDEDGCERCTAELQAFLD